MSQACTELACMCLTLTLLYFVGDRAYAKRPLSWSTRNRSFVIGYIALTHGRALPVVVGKSDR